VERSSRRRLLLAVSVAAPLVTVAAEDVFDACPRLHRISAPTLLVAGDRDRFSTPGLFREIVAFLTADRPGT
jgi:pimeloyl-ACP methyl ester carboxylesterase